MVVRMEHYENTILYHFYWKAKSHYRQLQEYQLSIG